MASTAGRTVAAIGPDDPLYPELVGRGYNLRFTGRPARVWTPACTEDVEHAVRESLRDGGRIAPRSGGHCFEDLVDGSGVRTVVDLSALRRVGWDRRLGAFSVGAGGRLGEVYRRLHLGWGVALPAGENPDVGVGGHVPGGGHGVLCRRDGLVVDHLVAVEVVVVDDDGGVRTVLATSDPQDPHHDLWWAHTGGGGGTFGVATRFLFRSPGAPADPARALPAAPDAVLRFRAEWSWAATGPDAFDRLVRNAAGWAAGHAAPGSPHPGLYAELYLHRRELGSHMVMGQVPAGPDAHRAASDHVAALTEGTGLSPAIRVEEQPWSAAVLGGLAGERPRRWRAKIKGSYLRAGFSPRQIEALYHHLSRTDTTVGAGMVTLMTYGGAVNAVAPGATAVAQRDCALKVSYLTVWEDPADDAGHLEWIRELYADVHAGTGGVPVPGPDQHGAYVNYPDTDLDDPDRNTSGWSAADLYFAGNHARLTGIRARVDPLRVFGNAVSPGS